MAGGAGGAQPLHRDDPHRSGRRRGARARSSRRGRPTARATRGISVAAADALAADATPAEARTGSLASEADRDAHDAAARARKDGRDAGSQDQPRSWLRRASLTSRASLPSGEDLEAVVGRAWLSKIGISALVVGLVLLMGYTLQYVGAWGKIGVGTGVALALIAIGVMLERVERYISFARPVIGGGWALLYFVAYAAHSIDAAQVITDPFAGMAVMVATAVGMILHSLRYRSQMITGFAYVLAFVAIDIGEIGTYSLVATGLLAASVVALYRRFGWYWLGRRRRRRHLPDALHPDGLRPSRRAGPCGLLVGGRHPHHLLAGLCRLRFPDRTGGRHRPPGALRHHRRQHGRVHGAVGATGHGKLPDGVLPSGRGGRARHGGRQRRLRHRPPPPVALFYGVYAAAAAFVAVPLAGSQLKLDGAFPAFAWMAIAVAILGAGVWRRVREFRLAGEIIGALAVAAAFGLTVFGAVHAGASDYVANGTRIAPFGSRAWQEMGIFLWGDPLLRRAVIIGIALVLFAGEWLALRLASRLEPRERAGAILAGHASTALLALLIGRDVAPTVVDPIWLAGAAFAFELGRGASYWPARLRGYILMVAAFFVIAARDAALTFPFVTTSAIDWLIVGGAAAAFYAIAYRIRTAGMRLRSNEDVLAWPVAHGGAVLFALLLRDVLPDLWLAPAFAAAALVWHEAGKRWPEPILRVQGYAFAVLAFAHLFVRDFASLRVVLGIDTAVVAALPTAAVLYYLRHAMRRAAGSDWLAELEGWAPLAFAIGGTVVLATLAKVVLPAAMVRPAWTGLVALLFVAGRTFAADYRAHAYVLVMMAVAHLFAVDFASGGAASITDPRVLAAVPLAAVLFVMRHFAKAGEDARWMAPAERIVPYVLSAAATLVMVVLARIEFGPVNVIAVWSAMAAAVLIGAGLVMPARDYRLHAYGLAVGAFFGGFWSGISAGGELFGLSTSVVVTSTAIAMLFGIALAGRRRRAALVSALTVREGDVVALTARTAEEWATEVFAAMAVVLTAGLIAATVTGNLLTISWAIEGLAVTVAGFAVKERTMRLSGLAILAPAW